MILAGVVAEEKASGGGGGGVVPAFLTSAKAVGPSAGTSAIDTTGATLLVGVLFSYNTNPAAPTDSESNSWVQIPGAPYGGGGGASACHLTIWYCFHPTTSATHTFTNPSQAFCGGIFLAFSGTLQTAGVIGNGNGTGAAPPPHFQTGSVTPSLNDVIIAFCAGDDFLSTLAIDSSFTTNAGLIQANSAAEAGAVGYLISPGTSPANPFFTTTGTIRPEWDAAIVCFHAA